jgi:hypothetical protein
MANEISVSATLKLILGDKLQNWPLGVLTDDITGTDYIWKTQIIAAAATTEPILLGDVATPGWMLARKR